MSMVDQSDAIHPLRSQEAVTEEAEAASVEAEEASAEAEVEVSVEAEAASADTNNLLPRTKCSNFN